MSKGTDIIGNRYGKLVVIEKVQNNPSKWLCQCDCGNQSIVFRSNLVRGLTKSCGYGMWKKKHGKYGTPDM